MLGGYDHKDAQSLVHLVTVENLIRSSVESREPSKISTHILRMKGKTCAWRMELQANLGWKLQNSFPRRNVAAGERNLYSYRA